MKKRFLSLLLAAVLFIGLLPGVSLTAQAAVTATKPSAGNGSAENPYQIGTAAELLWFANSVNNRGKTSICAVLTADINLSSVCSSSAGNWTPIGNSSNTAYAGTFDGNGYTISELYIKHTDTYSQPSGGLFGTIESGGIVKNLNMSGWIYIKISHSIQVGVICGYNKGTIMGCSSSGKVQGISTNTRVWVGGICGINSKGGTIQDCYTTILYGISGSATGGDE